MSLAATGRARFGVLGVVGAALFAMSMAFPFLFTIDDALFYLVIGNNIVDGRGITFSRVMPTNGFQPLWQAIVTVVVWACRLVGIDGGRGQLRVVMVLAWALLVLGLVLLNRLLRELEVGNVGRFAALLGVLIFLGGPAYTLATEANLVLVLALTALLMATRMTRHAGSAVRVRPAIALGAVLGLLLLARLDAVFLVVAIGVGMLVLGRRPRRVSSTGDDIASTAHSVDPIGSVVGGDGRGRWPGRAALAESVATAVVAAAVVAPYLLWNQVRFRHLMPISGAIKVDTSTLHFDRGAVGATAWVLLVLALVAAPIAFVGRDRERGPIHAWWLIALVGGTAASAFYFLFAAGPWTGGDWYHVPQLLGTVLVAAPAADRLAASPKRAGPWVVAGGLVGLVMLSTYVEVAFYATGRNRSETNGVERLGNRMRAVIPADAVVAVADFPGVLGVTSHRALVAFDGLTGDFAYQRSLRDKGAGCTFAAQGVQYLLARDGRTLIRGDGPDAPWTVPIGSWLFAVRQDRLTVSPNDLILSDKASGLLLFRYHPTCDRGRIGGNGP